MSAGLAAVLIAVSETATWHWLSREDARLLAPGSSCSPSGSRSESRSAHPLVDMRMMRIRGVWTTNAGRRCCSASGCTRRSSSCPSSSRRPRARATASAPRSRSAGLFMRPVHTRDARRRLQTGRLERRFGSKPPLLAGGALDHGLVPDPRLRAQRSSWEIYLAAALLGAGIGLAFAAMANLIIENVGPGETGVATGMNTVTRTVGGAFGGAATASILAATVTRADTRRRTATRSRSRSAQQRSGSAFSRGSRSRSGARSRPSSPTRPATSIRRRSPPASSSRPSPPRPALYFPFDSVGRSLPFRRRLGARRADRLPTDGRFAPFTAAGSSR